MIWKYRQPKTGAAKNMALGLNVPLKIGLFLAGRGFEAVEDVKLFLSTDLKRLPGPETMPGMDKAVEVLLAARKAGKTIAISGDYDVDGLTATALLQRVLEPLGFKIITRIPHRLEEGYGLSPEAVTEMASQGADLIITVDSGVSDYEAVKVAAQLGLEVIITDHHELPPELPQAAAIINPHLGGGWESSPLAGVGVSFMLAWAVRKACLEGKLIATEPAPLIDNLALVALGTVADMVPLVGANRILVHHGLNFLLASQWPGLWALKKKLRLYNQERISVRDVGFKLAPRLNAAGRLGSAAPALEILITNDVDQAEELARQLDELNRQRYETQNRLVEEALEMLEHEIPIHSRTVVLAKEGWPRGVLGLVASRVAEKSGRPTIMFTINDEAAVGSGRTVSGFNLFEALSRVRDFCLSMGGHSQAAGLKVAVDKLDAFRQAFEESAVKQSESESEAELLVDLDVELSELSVLARNFAQFEPYGQGHTSPVVVLKNIKVLNTLCRGSKLTLRVSDGIHRENLSGFNLASRLGEIGPIMDVAVSYEPDSGSSEVWRLIDFSNTMLEKNSDY